MVLVVPSARATLTVCAATEILADEPSSDDEVGSSGERYAIPVATSCVATAPSGRSSTWLSQEAASSTASAPLPAIGSQLSPSQRVVAFVEGLYQRSPT